MIETFLFDKFFHKKIYLNTHNNNCFPLTNDGFNLKVSFP